MNLRDVLRWLLEEKLIVIVGNQIVFTKKAAEDLKTLGFDTKIVENIALNTATPVQSVEPIHVGDKKQIWNQFIYDADIPHRVQAPDGGVYTVRQYSPGCADKLMRIIRDPKIDYSRLVESTKQYYKSVTYKALLGNYIDKEIWRSEYEAWDPKKPAPLKNGENRWEE